MPNKYLAICKHNNLAYSKTSQNSFTWIYPEFGDLFNSPIDIKHKIPTKTRRLFNIKAKKVAI